MENRLNKLKVQVDVSDEFLKLLHSINSKLDHYYRETEKLERKKPSLEEQRIEELKNFIANDLFDKTYNIEDIKVRNFETSSDTERYLRTDSSFEVDGKHIRCLSYDSSIIAMDNLNRLKQYESNECYFCFAEIYHIKYLNNVVVIVRDLNVNKTDNTQLAIEYIKDVLVEGNDRLFYIYYEEIGVNIDRRQKADIVNTLENKYGYNCKADEKGTLIERYDCIKKELANLLDLDSTGIYEGCELDYYEGNHVYGNIYYDYYSCDNSSYYVLIYNNFEDYIDDMIGLVEGNWIRTKELDNGFYMIALKDIPNIDECKE
ncbi:hypothetical protein GNF80_15660 [Clostridium perfringens]|nr:hypothetical protein [Clostridium perfringens]